MKLWDKGGTINELVENFTIGKDRELDLLLAKHDVLGSMAHSIMLNSINLLSNSELECILYELKSIYLLITNNEFVIEQGVEDVHSQVELMITRKHGDIGKKMHSGRSRNDQVLLDIKLFAREEISQLVIASKKLFEVLVTMAELHKSHLMPGYTHLQVAMPSSFGLWFSAYAESLIDDLVLLQAAYRITNQNPLGSAAGYGSSFPLDRQMTSDLLGFDQMNYNVVYAQMGRGKVEKTISFALSSIAATLSKLSFDVCMFMSQNFGFVKLPDHLTTGSSIMPHKKNPDVFELIRSRCNKIQGLPMQISLMINNLPSGYFRDYQLLKEIFFPAIKEMKECLEITSFAVSNLIIMPDIMKDNKYEYAFSVEEVNNLVMQGIPFREAYKKIGYQIEEGTFKPHCSVNHVHMGGIGNLCLTQIKDRMEEVSVSFNFIKIDKAIKDLLNYQP